MTPLVDELTAAARLQAEAAAARVADDAQNKIEMLRSELEAKAGEHAKLAADLEEVRARRTARASSWRVRLRKPPRSAQSSPGSRPHTSAWKRRGARR